MEGQGVPLPQISLTHVNPEGLFGNTEEDLEAAAAQSPPPWQKVVAYLLDAAHTRGLPLQLQDATADCLELTVRGHRLFLTLPGWLDGAPPPGGERREEDCFVATAASVHDFSALGDVLFRLNERFERVRPATPRALACAVDMLVSTLLASAPSVGMGEGETGAARGGSGGDVPDSAVSDLGKGGADGPDDFVMVEPLQVAEMAGADDGEDLDGYVLPTFPSEQGDSSGSRHLAAIGADAAASDAEDLDDGESSNGDECYTALCEVEAVDDVYKRRLSTLDTLAAEAAIACQVALDATPFPSRPPGCEPEPQEALQWCSVQWQQAATAGGAVVVLTFDPVGVLGDGNAAAMLGFQEAPPVEVWLRFDTWRWATSGAPETAVVPDEVDVAQGLLKAGGDDRWRQQAGGQPGLHLVRHVALEFFSTGGGLWAAEGETAGDNVFVALLVRLVGRLRSLPERCINCYDPLPCFPLGRMLPCTKELCLYNFEELGCGAAVLPQLRAAPALVEFEIACAAAAARSAALEPFPSFLLRGSAALGPLPLVLPRGPAGAGSGERAAGEGGAVRPPPREVGGRDGSGSSGGGGGGGDGGRASEVPSPLRRYRQSHEGGNIGHEALWELERALAGLPGLEAMLGCDSEAALLDLIAATRPSHNPCEDERNRSIFRQPIQNVMEMVPDFSEDLIRGYMRHILLDLDILHRNGTVHRDVKGSNILVSAQGHVRLADAREARHVDENLSSASCRDTVWWMAPEAISGAGNGWQMDIWSLGCTIIEMVTRVPPWLDPATGLPPWGNADVLPALWAIGRATQLPPIPDGISPALHDFVWQCLKIDPSLRPSARQLLLHPFVRPPGILRSGGSGSGSGGAAGEAPPAPAPPTPPASALHGPDEMQRTGVTTAGSAHALVRFVLATNRSSMRCLEPEELLLGPDGGGATLQILVAAGPPEFEAAFEQRRLRSGSTFAFFGASSGTWYSILRNGISCTPNALLPPLHSGDPPRAIHLSHDFVSQCPLFANRHGSYQSGSDKSFARRFTSVAICEVLRGPPTDGEPPGGASWQVLALPPGGGDRVAVRYLLVFDAARGSPDEWFDQRITGGGCQLAEHDLHAHFEVASATTQARQLAQQREQRAARRYHLRQLAGLRAGPAGAADGGSAV